MTPTYREQAKALVAKWKTDFTLLPDRPQHGWYAIRENELTDGLAAALQAQGERVEALTEKYKSLVAFYDRHNGTPCEQIRHQQEVETLQQQLATVEQVNQRVMQLEVVIRKSCGPELNCLSNMGIGFIEKAVYWYQQQLLTCEARVWEEAMPFVRYTYESEKKSASPLATKAKTILDTKESAPMSEPIRKDLLPGLYMTFSEIDGSWLHFDNERHKGALCLEAFAENDRVVGRAIKEWCATYRATL